MFKVNPFEKTIGKPVDYQVPLKNKHKNKDEEKEYIGKFDLVTYKESTNELFLVEVKADNSTETALKTILEIQTYSQVVNINRLVDNLRDSKGIRKNIEIKANPKIRKDIIVFANEKNTEKVTTPAKELKDSSRKQLQKLVDDFNIEVCYAK